MICTYLPSSLYLANRCDLFIMFCTIEFPSTFNCRVMNFSIAELGLFFSCHSPQSCLVVIIPCAHWTRQRRAVSRCTFRTSPAPAPDSEPLTNYKWVTGMEDLYQFIGIFFETFEFMRKNNILAISATKQCSKKGDKKILFQISLFWESPENW